MFFTSLDRKSKGEGSIISEHMKTIYVANYKPSDLDLYVGYCQILRKQLPNVRKQIRRFRKLPLLCSAKKNWSVMYENWPLLKFVSTFVF